MRKLITTAALAATVALGSAGVASASASASSPRVDWPARTCGAFAAYERRPSAARLDATMADSFHVPWKYLGGDIDSLYRAARSHGDTDLAGQYVYEDCHNGYGS